MPKEHTSRIFRDENKVTYRIYDEERAAVVWYPYGYAEEIVIPETIEGVVVDEIDSDVFRGNVHLKSLTLSDNIKKIGERAFLGCSSMETLKLGKNIEVIERGAFRYCYELKELDLPETVKEIGALAFNNANSLTEVTIPESVETFGSEAFRQCKNLERVTVNSRAEELSQGMFMECEALTDIELSEHVKTIGTSAFSGCAALTEYTVPDTVETVCSEAFTNCKKLTSFTIGKGVSSFAGDALYNSQFIKELNVDGANEHYTMSHGFLLSKDLKTLVFCPETRTGQVVVPETVETIGEMAFRFNRNATEIILPANVKKLCYRAMANLANPKTVVIMNPDCEIYDEEEVMKNYLRTLSGNNDVVISYKGKEGSTLQAYCEKYGYSFNGSDAEPVIVTTTAPSASVTTTTTAVTTAAPETTTIPETTAAVTTAPAATTPVHTTIYTTAPAATTPVHTTVYTTAPATTTPVYTTLYTTAPVTTIPVTTEPAPTDVFTDDKGISYRVKDDNTLVIMGIPEDTTSLTIKGTVNGMTVSEIAAGAFKDNKNLKTLYMPDTITAIGESAFEGCSALETLLLSEKLVSIGDRAFFGCSSLLAGNIPNSVKSVGKDVYAYCDSMKMFAFAADLDTIPEGLFNGCSNLKTVMYNPETTELKVIGDRAFKGCSEIDFPLPETLEEIGANAFEYCINIKKVVIPDSVKKIGANAFRDCSGLESFTLGKNVVELAGNALSCCINVKELNVSKDNESFIVKGNFIMTKDLKTLVLATDTVRDIVTVPEGVETIGYGAFEKHGLEKAIILPASLKMVEDHALYDLTGGQTIVFNSTDCEFADPQTSMDWYRRGAPINVYGYAGSTSHDYCQKHIISFDVIEHCTLPGVAPVTTTTSPVTTTIPATTTTPATTTAPVTTEEQGVTEDGFAYAVENGVVVIHGYGGNAERVVIPSEINGEPVRCIGEGAFTGDNVKNVVLPDTVLKVDSEAFVNCGSLTSVILPDNLNIVMPGAFSNCPKLKDVLFPEGCEAVTAFAYDCPALESVTICDPNTTITANAFNGKNVVIRGIAGGKTEEQAKAQGLEFVALDMIPEKGNVNCDRNIDASDASNVLVAYAKLSTGKESDLTIEQRRAADVDGDGMISASDASFVLMYYAYLSTGGENVGFKEWYLNHRNK